MRTIAFKTLIIVCMLVLSFLFYKNLNEVNEKIANHDIVLILVENHDAYHEIYMQQFEGIHDKEETRDILKKVYLNDSHKIVKAQVQIENQVVKKFEDISEEDLNKFEKYEFKYIKEADIISIKGLEDDNE